MNGNVNSLQKYTYYLRYYCLLEFPSVCSHETTRKPIKNLISNLKFKILLAFAGTK